MLFAAYAWAAGEDSNWDLHNYHDYAAYALLHWRYPLDMAPGGWQSTFNPLPYVPRYLLNAALPPLSAAIAVAVTQALVVPVAWALAWRLSPSWPTAVLATLTGLGSATALSEIGASFADLSLAALVLGALLYLLSDRIGRRQWLLSGFMLGVATGLKLTNGPFALALAAAALTPWPGRAAALRTSLWIGLGLAAGAAVSTGPWCAFLWSEFGNPVFPGFNTLFRSASAAPIDLPDARFLPHGLLDALSYPFNIALGLHPTAEVPFADPRFALVLVLGSIAGARALWTACRAGAERGSDPAIPRASVFLGVAASTWLLLFAIARYAVALEILAGILAVVLAAGLARGRLAQGLLAAAVALFALVETQPSDWGHRPWGEPPAAAPPGLTQPAAFLIVAQPLGYWVSALTAASRFYLMVPVGLGGGGVLRTRMVDGLAAPPGGRVWTLGFDIPMGEGVRAAMAGLGFAPASPCLRARGLSWYPTIFCHADRVGVRRLAAPDLTADQSIDFGNQGAGWIYEVSGWQPAEADQTQVDGEGRLALRPVVAGGAMALEFTAAPRAGTDGGVQVWVDGRPVTQWTLPPAAWTKQVLCVPASPGDGVLDVTFHAAAADGPKFAIRSMRLRSAASGECP